MRGLAFIPTLVANPARDLFCAPLMPIHYQSRGYKTPNIHFRTHTHIFRHERLCAIFLLLFVRARCITLATAAGVFVCVRDDKSKSSKTHTHASQKQAAKISSRPWRLAVHPLLLGPNEKWRAARHQGKRDGLSDCVTDWLTVCAWQSPNADQRPATNTECSLLSRRQPDW